MSLVIYKAFHRFFFSSRLPLIFSYRKVVSFQVSGKKSSFTDPMHRKKPYSVKQKKKQLQAKRERQREAAENEDKKERGEYVPEKREPTKPKDPNANNGRRNVWVSNVTDDSNSLRTVFEKEPNSVIEARKKSAMEPITRKVLKVSWKNVLTKVAFKFRGSST
jgi:hypothetical protein